MRFSRPRVKNAAGLDLHGGRQARAHDAIADFRTGQGQAALFFLGVRLRRRDIEQGAPDAGVGHVRGDTRAHGACAQDHDFFDGSFHMAAFGGMGMPFPCGSGNEFQALVQVTEATIPGQRETPEIAISSYLE